MYDANFLRRFWLKIEVKGPEECWNWKASTAGKGYGQIKPPGGSRLNLYAHRVSFEIHHGPVPQGREVCHRCDNPLCCNPAHLFAGTRKENAEDMGNKMRSGWGSRNARAKLTDADVGAIRKLIAGGMAQVKIAALFNISQIQISRIKTGKRWSKVKT